MYRLRNYRSKVEISDTISLILALGFGRPRSEEDGYHHHAEDGRRPKYLDPDVFYEVSPRHVPYWRISGVRIVPHMLPHLRHTNGLLVVARQVVADLLGLQQGLLKLAWWHRQIAYTAVSNHDIQSIEP